MKRCVYYLEANCLSVLTIECHVKLFLIAWLNQRTVWSVRRTRTVWSVRGTRSVRGTWSVWWIGGVRREDCFQKRYVVMVNCTIKACEEVVIPVESIGRGWEVRKGVMGVGGQVDKSGCCSSKYHDEVICLVNEVDIIYHIVYGDRFRGR